MKKSIIVLTALLFYVSANAQNAVGKWSFLPKAGINISTITGDVLYDKKSKVGFVGGVEAEYGIAKNFGLAAGVLYSMEGAKAKVGKAANNAIGMALVDGKYNLS